MTIGTYKAGSVSVPIPAEGIGTRISAACDCLGTRKNAASVMGVSVDSLARYIREENEPPFGVLARLSLASGKSLDWLATGMEPETQAGPAISAESQFLRLDQEILAEAIEAVDAGLDALDSELSTGGRARVITAVYAHLVSDAKRRSTANAVAFTLNAIREASRNGSEEQGQ